MPPLDRNPQLVTEAATEQTETETRDGAPAEEGLPAPGAGPPALRVALRLDLPRRVADFLKRLAAEEFGGSINRLLEWFADAYDQIVAEEAACGPREEAIQRREEELDRQARDWQRRRRQLEEEEILVRRRLGLSEEAFELLASLMEQGVSKPEILAVCRVLREARMEPSSVAEVLRRAMGLAQYAEQLSAMIAQAEALRDQTLEEVQAAKLALRNLQQEAGQLTGLLREAKAAEEEARRRLGAVQDAAREVGIYLELLGDQRVEDLGARAAQVAAGSILLVAMQMHPELGAVRLLPPSPKVGRFLPTPILLSDVVGLLGSPEDYHELQARLQQRAAVARRWGEMATGHGELDGPVPAEEGGGG
jgi:hypothetical protein